MKVRLSELVFERDEDGVLLNPRGKVADTTDLQASLVEIGQVVAIVVSPVRADGKRRVYHGHRRVTAARALGWKEIEADELVSPATQDGVRALILASHAQEAHDPLKVGEAIQKLLAADWSKLRIARVMACAPQKIDVYLALATAPKTVQAAVKHGAMTLTAYTALYAQDAEVQKAVVARVTADAAATAAGPDAPPKRGRKHGALTVVAVRKAVKKLAAEKSPYLLDDEKVIEQVNAATTLLAEIATRYAGGLPANVGWRMRPGLAAAQSAIGQLLNGGGEYGADLN